jgi:GNAT superfamily N-acetyltransferase
MRFIHTNGQDPAFVSLCTELDAYLNELAGGVENRAQYVPHNKLDFIRDAFVTFDGETPVGCASFKRFDEDTAEIKRVFVKPEYRGRGIARAILALLEQAAKERGYARLLLETGAPLVAAHRLYLSTGYSIIPNYGPYADMPESICMEKRL